MSSPDTPSMPGAEAAPCDSRLDALDAAAVGLLEPLISAMPIADGTSGDAPRSDWRAGLADALGRLSQAASSLGLWGLAQVVSLLVGHLRAEAGAVSGRMNRASDAASGVLAENDAAIDLALAEAWVGDAIAFCSGQLPVDESRNLIERLRDWPVLAETVTPQLFESIAARLRQDTESIAAATLADLRAPVEYPEGDGVAARAAGDETGAADATGASDAVSGKSPARAGEPLSIGRDELQMLAEAAGQLDEEFGEAFAAVSIGGALDRVAQAIEHVADAIERYANAIAYVGLAPAADALFALHRNLATLAHDPATFGERHRRLLARLPTMWAHLFERPSIDAARLALAPLADSAWPIPAESATLDAAQRAFGSFVTVGTRRVSAGGDEVDEDDMSLAIPHDADRDVVDNLLRELPTLSAEFSQAIERVHAGANEELTRAQRIAHTLKGSANTVGIRGIAVLTHQLEDLLQLLEAVETPLAPGLADTLSDAADCLAEMSEAVAGIGPAPDNALAVHREVQAWTNRVLQEPAAAWEGDEAGEAGGSDRIAEADRADRIAATEEAEAPDRAHAEADAPHRAHAPAQVAARRSDAEAQAPSPGSEAVAQTAQGGAPEAQDWLRVPASLIERLLAFANEASILLSQAQERAIEVDRVRATLGGGTDQLQDLAAELERLVDVRGLALSDRRDRDDFDPLELDEHSDLQMVSRRIAESGADGRLIEQHLSKNVAALRDSLSQLERLQVDLREVALQTRTVRVETVAPRWQRTVRQAARMAAREVSLEVVGEQIEIDAQLLQSLVEPVGHLLRNAVDHGIEPLIERERGGKPRAGRIVLELRRDGGDLLVECSDDGGGLDRDAIRERAIAMGLADADDVFDDEALGRLVVQPGFSTRDRATQLSGRGIGLDVVGQLVREQRGSIEISTQPSVGTRVRLRLPVRMAALPVIVVRSPTHVLALSVRDVEEIHAADRLVDEPNEELRLRDGDRTWPVVRLVDALGLPEDAFVPPPGTDAAAPVVFQVRMPDGSCTGLLVPEPGQPRNVVMRPLASFLPPVSGLEGATVLGDGAVAAVFDLPRLLAGREGARAAPAIRDTLRTAPVCLVVDDSVSVRRTMEQFVRDLGFEPDSAADGVDALECVQRRVPAIVLVDLEMPRMNGVEFVRALRADPETHAVPVIMLTSRSSDKHRSLALDAGVDVFLTKPYTEDVLASHITRQLAAREAAGREAAGREAASKDPASSSSTHIDPPADG